MEAKLTRPTHKIAIQLHSVAESCTICGSRSRRPVQKLLDTPSYVPPDLSSGKITNFNYIFRRFCVNFSEGLKDKGMNRCKRTDLLHLCTQKVCMKRMARVRLLESCDLIPKSTLRTSVWHTTSSTDSPDIILLSRLFYV